MSGYAFSSAEIAQFLKDYANANLAGLGGTQAPLGREVIFVKTPEDGIDKYDGNEFSQEDCDRVYFAEMAHQEDSSCKIPVVNVEETDIEGDKIIKAVRVGSYWVALNFSSETDVPKRVKFVLTGKLMTDTYCYWADAKVIDPMNSGKAVDDVIKVRDPRGQFQFAGPDCMGIATFSKLGDALYLEGPNPPDTFTDTDQGQWIIEQCDQLTNKVRATMQGGIIGWSQDMPSATTITIEQRQSYWPYIHDHEDDDGDISDLCINSHRFTANDGLVWLERRVKNIFTPDDTRTVTPVEGSVGNDPSEVLYEWHVVRVEKPTARYVETTYNDPAFEVTGDFKFYEGEDPSTNNAFTDHGGEVIDGFEADCPLKDGEKGLAFLDDRDGQGKYRTFTTQSGMYGTARRINAVAESSGIPFPSGSPQQGPIGTDANSECGEFKYNLLKNIFVFGNPDDSATDCKMDYEDPPIEIDTFVNAEDVTVVTGTEINSGTGELEFTTKSIKGCPTDGSNIPLSFNTTDVVTDISCVGDGLQKSYKTIKYLGSEVSSTSGVGLPCTDPANYNWETIFNNYVYNEDWWNVSYYDITWPSGCTPCDPVGCCDGGSYDGQVVTQADCELGGGTYDGDGTDCSGGGDCTGSECCCGSFSAVTIQMSCPPAPGGGMGGMGGGASNVAWDFVSLGTVDGDGSCNWTVAGTWTITDSNGGTSTTSGSVTLTHDGGGDFSGTGTVDGNAFTLNSDGSACFDGGTPCSCGANDQWTYTMDSETECQGE